jgi:uncharacterized protein YdhG (YjbR/CyaY superfamily)
MAKNGGGDVESYLGGVEPKRQEAMIALREACLELLPGFQETMRYNMPSYVRDDEVEVAFASRAQYISLYVLRTDVMAAHRARLDGLSVGKGCIRYRKPEQVDLDVVRSMPSMTASSVGPVC